MFNNISWSSYLIFTGSITAAYYFLIGIIFYRNEINKIIYSGNTAFFHTKQNSAVQNSNTNSTNELMSSDIKSTIEKEDILQSSMVHELTNELNILFKNAFEKGFQKPELIMALQLELKNYMRLKESPFYEAINSLIELESQTQCSIYLNDGELELLWKA